MKAKTNNQEDTSKIPSFLLVNVQNNVQLCRTILLDMAFTIRTVCREYSRLIKEGAKSDTMIELNLAICKDGKTVFKSYKIKGKLLLKDWNQTNSSVRKGCIYADELNRIIKDTTLEYNQIGLQWENSKKEFTASDLMNYAKIIKSTEDVLSYLEHLIDYYKKLGSGNFAVYSVLLHDMRKFTLKKQKRLSDIDNKFFIDYAQWCTDRGNNPRSISMKFSRMKTVLTKAKDEGISVADITATYKPNKTKPIKRGLSENDVINLLNYKPHKLNWEFVLDMFKFMYYSAGTPIRDLAFLTKDNIIEKQLSYVRFKTHKVINVPLPDEAMAIIAKYSDHNSKYLFPIIPKDRQHLNYIELYKYIGGCTYKFNLVLEQIGKKLNLPIKLTTYVVRHSYATQLLRSGIPLPMISKALGHSSIQMTQNYLNLNDFDLTQTFDCLTPKPKKSRSKQ